MVEKYLRTEIKRAARLLLPPARVRVLEELPLGTTSDLGVYAF